MGTARDTIWQYMYIASQKADPCDFLAQLHQNFVNINTWYTCYRKYVFGSYLNLNGVNSLISVCICQPRPGLIAITATIQTNKQQSFCVRSNNAEYLKSQHVSSCCHLALTQASSRFLHWSDALSVRDQPCLPPPIAASAESSHVLASRSCMRSVACSPRSCRLIVGVNFRTVRRP